MSEPSLAIRKFSDLANPTRFLALVATLLAWLVVAAMPGLVGRTAAHRGEEGGKPPA